MGGVGQGIARHTRIYRLPHQRDVVGRWPELVAVLPPNWLESVLALPPNWRVLAFDMAFILGTVGMCMGGCMVG